MKNTVFLNVFEGDDPAQQYLNCPHQTRGAADRGARNAADNGHRRIYRIKVKPK